MSNVKVLTASLVLLTLSLNAGIVQAVHDASPVVLAEGAGPGAGWATATVTLPAGSNVWLDLRGHDVVGAWSIAFFLRGSGASPSGSLVAYGSEGSGVRVHTQGFGPEDVDHVIVPARPSDSETARGGLGWVQSRDFVGNAVFVFGGSMVSHSWRIMTDGPGHAQASTSGSGAIFLTGDQFQSASTSATASAGVLTTQAIVDARQGAAFENKLFGAFLNLNDAACVRVTAGGCAPAPSTASLSYARGNTTSATEAYGWAFAGEKPGTYDFRIQNHAALHPFAESTQTCLEENCASATSPGGGIILLAADVTLTDP